MRCCWSCGACFVLFVVCCSLLLLVGRCMACVVCFCTKCCSLVIGGCLMFVDCLTLRVVV